MSSADRLNHNRVSRLVSGAGMAENNA